MSKTVTVHTRLQPHYEYVLTEPEGKNFDPQFRPQLTPQQMLELGVFGGNYFEGEQGEYPKSWFKNAVLSQGKYDIFSNYFKVKASQSREEWAKKGWLHADDPRGWFEWYCRYYRGRRHKDDVRQIKRWSLMVRHIRWLQGACMVGDVHCRPRQRQALLHWGYDSRVL